MTTDLIMRVNVRTATTTMAVENRLTALRFARSARATSARARRTFVPASWWLWAYSRKLRSWSCTQPRAAKATAVGVAVGGKVGSIPRAAAVV